jgi:hypothetical protein
MSLRRRKVMATYSSRDITICRREYSLPSPTNVAEVAKVFAAINQNLATRDGYSDDFVTVEARDDEIIFSFEISKVVG